MHERPSGGEIPSRGSLRKLESVSEGRILREEMSPLQPGSCRAGEPAQSILALVEVGCVALAGNGSYDS
ncbi:hypothetical protein DES53_11547 [Roseimicrobium gellanilyticum]|uniref:Uncharacterized protein n=1 Tax=Roseimicrobium gellanilyticum TaxID=748857 RepID=A0A366H6L8_9BACT|nr:hypothetical protein DES53_11547 [Roseimicrobium gellanilyticum]